MVTIKSNFVNNEFSIPKLHVHTPTRDGWNKAGLNVTFSGGKGCKYGC